MIEFNSMRKLLFRQQFILGPRYSDQFSSWQKHEISPSIFITAHPDFTLAHYTIDDRSLILLGYLIDPQRPHHTNDRILKRLLSENFAFIDLIKATDELCGNWILIYKLNAKIFLFHDCIGARSVFYTKMDKTNDLWCASQPRLIADILDLNEKKYAIDFILAQRAQSHNHWWPGDTSPYSEIRRLLPNNYLDLNKGEICRFWPDKETTILNKNEAIEKISKRLKKIMLAAVNRFDLAIALSAGLDSRVMLAACKNIKEKVCVCNTENPNISSKHPDLVIPKRLSSMLDVDFHYIPAPKVKNDAFFSILEMNAPYPTMEIAAMLQAELDYYNLNKVCSTGNVLEIVRCYYHYKNGDMKNPAPNGKLLAERSKMANSEFAIEAFDRWLKSVKNIKNIDIYDMFGWEQRHGSWLSNACLIENTSWKEMFFPFNCRNLLIDFLSVNDKHRMPPDFTLFIHLMHYMWPEVLSEPINPKSKTNFIKKYLQKIKNFKPIK